MSNQGSVKEKSGVQIVDSPGAKKRYAIRPMDRVDSIVSAELHSTPPKDDEHIFVSPTILVFHDAAGKVKSFSAVTAVSTDGRSSNIGGWIKTSDPDEIKALDEYCIHSSADVRKMYPV